MLATRCSSRDDLDPGRGTDSRGTGGDHMFRIVGATDAAGGLDPDLGTDCLAHEGHVVYGGAAAGIPGRGLDKVGARLDCETRCHDLLLIGEQHGLEDHLAQRSRLTARLGDTSDVALRASIALISGVVAPNGNPTTQQATTSEPFNASATRFAQTGLTHTEAKPYSRASSHMRSISDAVASGLSRV